MSNHIGDANKMVGAPVAAAPVIDRRLANWIIAAVGDIPYSTMTSGQVIDALRTNRHVYEGNEDCGTYYKGDSTPAAPGIDLIARLRHLLMRINNDMLGDDYKNLSSDALALIDASPKGGSTDAKDAARYRHLQKVTPFRFKKLRDTAVTDAVDVLYFHADRFDAALDAHMQATSAEVVA